MKDCIAATGGKPFEGVIHIGAHLGEEAEDYQNHGVKRVVWIEANPDLMTPLKQATGRFKFETQGYINTCLSDVDGDIIEFNVSNNGQSSSILELGTHATMYPHIKYTKKIKTRARRFEELVKEKAVFPYEDYDFINIDVQGAELMVFKGFGDLLEKKNIRAIYTEINLEHVYKGCCLLEELDEYLGKYQFKRTLSRAPERTWGDSLYQRMEP